MTSAPACLLDARRLLLDHLPIPGAAIGIIGDTNHRGGYHCGSDRVVDRDYSVIESSRDRAGLTLDAAALDVGTFTWRGPDGRTHNLRTFSLWVVAQCEAGAADARDIREVIYSPDGRTVRRWDRLGRRSSGDSSHLYHTHFSFHRDAIKVGRGPVALFRRYLAEIGRIGDDMAAFTDAHAATLATLGKVLPTLLAQVAYIDGRIEAEANGRETVRADLKGGGQPVWTVKQLGAILGELRTLSALLGQQGGADVSAIVAGVLAGLSPQAIAEAIPAELAEQVADILAARLAS